MDKKGWLATHQIAFFVVLLFVGAFLSDTTLLAPLHEWAHWYTATEIERGEARIIDLTHTAIRDLTKMNLLAGYTTEVSTVMIAFAVFFLLSSSVRSNWRKYFFHLGLFLGYATYTWIKPYTREITDFVLRPAWTHDLKTMWFFMPGIFVATGWIVLIRFRLRPYLRTN